MAAAPTTSVLSLRHARPWPWHAHVIATEELFVATTGAARFDVHVPSGRVRDTLWGRRLMRRTHRWASHVEPTPAPSRRADLGVMWVSDLGDVGELLDVDPGWVDFAATRVLVVSECWPGDLDLHGPKIRAVVEGFDAVFVSMESGCLAPVRDAGVSVSHLPHGVVTDAYRPNTSGCRPIGVLNYGRRDPGQHAVLVAWDRESGGWYHYDTMSLGRTSDPLDHQRVLGRLMSESSFSVCNLGRFDDPSRTAGASELGARFYEALGAGCALIGDFPASATFEAHFGDAPGLVPFPLGADACPDEMMRLLTAPEKLGRVQRSHRALALRHHDIAHRVAAVVEAVGFEPAPALVERRAQLCAAADELTAA